MDLQVGVIISTVFMVSFLSYLFISKFLPHGKTFDEMIAEKKKMREEMLGTLKPANKYGGNSGNKRKPKKEVKKKDSPPKVQVAKVTETESEEEEEEDENFGEELIVKEPVVQKPSTVNKRKNKKKNSESEEIEEIPKEKEVRQVIIEQSTTSPNGGNKNKPSQTNQPSKKKGKGGILMNKNEPSMVKDNPVEEVVNHFEESHPKDAIEIQRTSSVVEHEKNTRNFRENKKAKKETPPVSPKSQPVKEVVVKQKRSVAPSTVDNGPVADENSITPLIRDLSRADLTKNQIQVLIDFLLNKQSDTIVRDPTEWSEGKSDILQKIRKQLQEKEAQLKNEQDALSGMQMKLKDLRAEFNNEKIQNNAALKAHMEQMHNLKAEIKGLQTEIQFLNEKHNNEKQSMTLSFKQLQQKYLQVSENLKTFESLPNVQQIQADNQLLQNEIISKNQQITELKVFADESRKMDEAYKQKLAECDSKIAELEVCLRKKDDNFMLVDSEMRQRVQDLAIRDGEIQKLTTEVVHVKELLQRQTIEKEKLNQQLDTLHQNNHAEENKIEIRNLQNALDSSKKDIESQGQLVNDYKMRIDDLTKQVTEAKQLTQKSGDSFLLNEKLNEMAINHQNIIGEKDKQLADYQKQIEGLQKAQSDLSKQIEEQKAKNNDLRMKNWKLVEALQAAQTSSTSKMTSNHNTPVVHENGIDVKTVKDLITQYFPDHVASAAASDDEAKWLKSVLENLKTEIVSNNQSNHSTPTPINANHLNNNSNNNCHDVEKSNSSSTKALNGDTNSTSSPSSSGDNEIILLQNAQLRTTVEEYKNIISETESMLKNLESKVREQDAYWSKVVLMKDNEIENLKTHVQES